MSKSSVDVESGGLIVVLSVTDVLKLAADIVGAGGSGRRPGAAPCFSAEERDAVGALLDALEEKGELSRRFESQILWWLDNHPSIIVDAIRRWKPASAPEDPVEFNGKSDDERREIVRLWAGALERAAKRIISYWR